MNDSSDLQEQEFYRSQKPPRSGRPTRPLQYENLDKARLDHLVPDAAVQSARSSKRVHFDKANKKPTKRLRDQQQYIDQDDSRPDVRLVSGKKQKAALMSEPESFDQPQPVKRMKGGIPMQDYGRGSGGTPMKEFVDNNRFYPKSQTQEIPMNSKRSMQSQAFEPQYQSSRQVLSWQAKPTKEGFLFFYIPGTNTFQWQFPTYFDTKTNKKKACFLENWSQKSDNTSKVYYVNKVTGQSQDVKPDSETYILQAAMLGNIAFMELYISVRGDIAIEDQRGRNALHQAVSNGHHQTTQILCEFGINENLIERSDKYGNTPLFNSIRYNQTDCLQIMLQYNCNLFHRNKKGDTCLHYAAQYNSEECIIILSSFCGEQMLQQRNKEGLRAIDVAESLRNYSCVNTLQVCERNIVYQNALLFRDQNQKGEGKKGMKSANALMTMSNRDRGAGAQQQMEGPVPKRNPNVKTYQDEEVSQDSQEDSDRPSHLDYQDHYQKAYSQRNQEKRVIEHEREYKQKTQRDRRLEKQGEQRVPRFVSKRGVDQPKSFRQQQNLQESYFDEELNSRVSQAAKQRQRDERYQVYPRQVDEEEPTVFEKAYDNLSKVGTFFSGLTSRVVDYVYAETPRASSRSRNRVLPQNEPPQVRSRSRSLNEGRRGAIDEDTYNSEFDYQKDLGGPNTDGQSSGSENYKTTYDRSQSRPATAPRSRSRPAAFQLQTDDSLMPAEQPVLYSQRIKPIEPIHNPSNLKFENQKWPVREPSRQRSPPKKKSVSPPPTKAKMVTKATEVSQDASIVEMRSICIQAQPPKRVRRHRRADISKHSVGVGSQRIDETTMPLQNLSETNIDPDSSNSKLALSRIKKLKKIKLGNQNKNLIQKRYQSEEDDKKRLEDSKNYSPSPQPKYMKPEVVIIRRADLMDNGFKKQELQEPTAPSQVEQAVEPAGAPGISHNNSVVSVHSRRSIRSTRIQAPTNLTQEQFDIVNLNGKIAPSHQNNSQYKLEDEILAEIQSQEAPPLLLQPTSDPVTYFVEGEGAEVPPKQDEKIQIKDFYAQLANDASSGSEHALFVADFKPSNNLQPPVILDLEFNPEEQDEENYQHHNENRLYFDRSQGEETLIADLNEEHLTQMSDPSFMPTLNQFRLGHMSAASVDRGHLNLNQSNNQQHSITNINQRSFLKPLKMMQQYPDSDCDSRPTQQNRRKIIMPVLPKRAQQPKELDLFSQDSERARLQSPAPKVKEQVTSKVVTPDDSYVFQGIKSPDQSLDLKQPSIKIDVPPLLQMLSNPMNPPLSLHSQDRTSSQKNNSNKGGANRYSGTPKEAEVEDDLIQFDITQEITLTQEITQNVLIEEANNDVEIQVGDISEISILQELSQAKTPHARLPQPPMLPKKSFQSQRDQEPDEAHVVEMEEHAQLMQDEIDTISMIYGGLEDATIVHGQEEMKIESATKTPIAGYQSSGDECFQFAANRSTAVRRNTFMSSDDEAGHRGAESSKLKKAVNKQMHMSSLGNQTKERYKNRKSVKEVSFKRSSNKDKPETVDGKIVDPSPTMIGEKPQKEQQSVADRLKASMASFKQNKLTMDKDKNRSTLTAASRSKQATPAGLVENETAAKQGP